MQGQSLIQCPAHGPSSRRGLLTPCRLRSARHHPHTTRSPPEGRRLWSANHPHRAPLAQEQSLLGTAQFHLCHRRRQLPGAIRPDHAPITCAARWNHPIATRRVFRAVFRAVDQLRIILRKRPWIMLGHPSIHVESKRPIMSIDRSPHPHSCKTAPRRPPAAGPRLACGR